MNATLRPLARPSLSILEELEARIAPATLVVGGDVGYSDSPFSPTTGSNAIGDYFDHSTEHFYLQLSKGDKVLFDNAGTTSQWIEIKGGNAYAFFYDANHDGNVTKNEFTGLSVGGISSVVVNGSINGSVVTNNNEVGVFLGNSLSPGAKNYISGLKVTEGSVTGNILSAGKIGKINVSGTVPNILNGTATTGAVIDFGGASGAGDGMGATYTPTAKEAGALIKDITVGNVISIRAGNGGVSAAGGSIGDITLNSAFGDHTFAAGAGGNGGNSGSNLTGGAGGVVVGVTLLSDGSTGNLTVTGGAGGDGIDFGRKTGNGGKGGYVQDVTYGAFYDKVMKEWRPSSTNVVGDVVISGGTGGDGFAAGAGGALKDVRIITQNSAITLQSGQGGDALTLRSGDGAGGEIKFVTAVSIAKDDSGDSHVIVKAGDGGTVTDIGKSNAGGKIKDVTAAGYFVEVLGGNGSKGAFGKAGGDVTGVTASTDYTATRFLTVKGGFGAESTGSGGKGGSVEGVYYDSLPYTTTLYPSGFNNYYENGEGGSFSTDVPSYGWDLSGSFTDVSLDGPIFGNVLFQNSPPTTITGNVVINGDVYGQIVLGENTTIDGDLTINGASGAGLFLVTSETNPETGQAYEVYTSYADDPAAFATIVAGTITIADVDPIVAAWQVAGANVEITGGDGGLGGSKGGDGGFVSDAFVRTYATQGFYGLTRAIETSWIVNAGKGGNGDTGGGGIGGSILDSDFYGVTGGSFSEVTFKAGNGGSGITGGAGGNGGSILNTMVTPYGGNTSASAFDAKLGAGHGGKGIGSADGGDGGSIVSSSLYLSLKTNGAVTGGKGGGTGNGTAGLGGGILKLEVGSYSPFVNTLDIVAGSAAIGDLTTAKAAAGGSIVDLKFSGLTNAEVNVTAGNGSHGGIGGSVDKITSLYADYSRMGEAYYLNPASYDLTVTAGNGGAGFTNSGAGGSIKNVTLPVPAEMKTFSFTAGNGADGSKAGAGGNVEKLTLLDQMSITVYEAGKPKKVTAKVDYAGGTLLGTAEITTGTGGDSFGTANGGKGGDAKTVAWGAWDPAYVNALARTLTLGFGGTSTQGNPGAAGVAVNVDPNPNAVV